MIEVKSVSKIFGSVVALNNVSFKAERGDIIGLLGPNGAGKSTLMRILTCYFAPTLGWVKIDGMNVEKNAINIKKKIGYFPEEIDIYPEMRVMEFLDFAANLKGINKTDKKQNLDQIIESCGLGDVRKRIIGNLSKGYRRRVGLSQALLNDPQLLLLDEPTIGLDPPQVLETRRLIKGLTGKRTVIISTHILPEVTQMCNKVVILNKGNVILEDNAERLEMGLSLGMNRLHARIECPEDHLIDILKEAPDFKDAQLINTIDPRCFEVMIEAKIGTDIPKVLCDLAFRNKWVLREIRPDSSSLEENFMEIVTKERS